MKFPGVEILAAAADSAELALTLPPDLLYFQGHFPQGPILPGVAQIDWAVHYGRERFPLAGAFQGMEALKFQKVIQPGESVTLRLDYSPARSALKFQYLSAKGRHSSGTLLFGGPA
jgi:3-hydroxymyristoyl/3-hydroxydecanoyl-(acyl carrier protein) dehydratase